MTETLTLVEGRVEWRQVGDEVVVLDLREQRYLAVNRSGTILWPMLRDGTTRAAMVAALVDAYALDEHTATTDVDAFVGDLERRGVLHRSSQDR